MDALNHPQHRADERHKIDEMELTEEIFRTGDNYIVDEIETDGPEMLITKYGESEIAFGVTGRDIKCAGHKLSMIGRCPVAVDQALLFGTFISRTPCQMIIFSASPTQPRCRPPDHA